MAKQHSPKNNTRDKSFQTSITNFYSPSASPKRTKERSQKDLTEEPSYKKENRSPKLPSITDSKRERKNAEMKWKPAFQDEEKNNPLSSASPAPEPVPQRRNSKIRSDRIDELVKSRKKDTVFYRKGYPGLPDNLDSNDNVSFYKNELSSSPDGDLIDNIHQKWWGDYKRLEIHHGYIQWLFPIKELGMNYRAKELFEHEAEIIRSTPECKARVLLSYKMMLDFYGLRLVDEETGEIVRAENWKERFAHLNRSFHNYLRITRILKSLGELGFEHLKLKFVEFMLKEIILEGTLPNLFDSCVGFWLMVLRDNQERVKVIRMAKDFCDRYNGVVTEYSDSPVRNADSRKENPDLLKENLASTKENPDSQTESLDLLQKDVPLEENTLGSAKNDKDDDDNERMFSDEDAKKI